MVRKEKKKPKTSSWQHFHRSRQLSTEDPIRNEVSKAQKNDSTTEAKCCFKGLSLQAELSTGRNGAAVTEGAVAIMRSDGLWEITGLKEGSWGPAVRAWHPLSKQMLLHRLPWMQDEAAMGWDSFLGLPLILRTASRQVKGRRSNSILAN